MAAESLGVPEAQVEAAKARAAELLADKEGLADLRRLLMAMGVPAARILLTQLVASTASPRRGAGTTAALLREIDAISPVKEVGCMNVSFHDRLTGQPSTVYLVLEECPRDHDLGAQLDVLQPRIAPDRWPEIQRHLSAMVFYARLMYAQAAKENLPLIRRILGRGSADPCAEYLSVHVDPANTTLYVTGPEWGRRVGIFVHEAGSAGAPSPQSPA